MPTSTDDYENLTALYMHDVDLGSLAQSLKDSDVPDERISTMSPLPLSERSGAHVGTVPLYVVTIAAGLVGIGVGLFFSGGTAVMYPLMTGGKPIVSAPILGIISYETMMLSAIVVTFITMIATIKRSHGPDVPRDTRIDDGYIMLVVSLPTDPTRVSQIRALLQRAGPVEIRSPEQASSDRRASAGEAGPAAAVVGLAAVCTFFPFAGCSRDMQEQPSYQPQEAPRLHSPTGAVPRDSRSVIRSTAEPATVDEGARLYRINCLHCHGAQAAGNGPVAPYLKEKPKDLRNPDVQRLSADALYRIVTDGKDVMPPFKGELSAGERRSVAAYVKSLSQP